MNFNKEEIQRLKIAIENEIIIAQRNQKAFARKVSVDLLSSIVQFIDFKMAETEIFQEEIRGRDERIKVQADYIISQKEKIEILSKPIKKAIPETQDIETLRKDAVAILRAECIGDSEFMELAKQLGADALAKEIPQKVEKTFIPLFDTPFYTGQCPSCNEIRCFTKLPSKKSNISRCENCGQALDWGDSDA